LYSAQRLPTPGFAQVQDPSMSGEVNKDTVHVNEDLLPKKRTWELIPDPWIDPENSNIIKLNPEDKKPQKLAQSTRSFGLSQYGCLLIFE
jgi:hypothetical protein